MPTSTIGSAIRICGQVDGGFFHLMAVEIPFCDRDVLLDEVEGRFGAFCASHRLLASRCAEVDPGLWGEKLAHCT